jgi:cbb3-type cytochrome oxidase subunit 1
MPPYKPTDLELGFGAAIEGFVATYILAVIAPIFLAEPFGTIPIVMVLVCTNIILFLITILAIKDAAFFYVIGWFVGAYLLYIAEILSLLDVVAMIIVPIIILLIKLYLIIKN